MKEDLPLVRRGSQTLHADPRRVLAQLFLPGQELTSNGRSRADAVVDRVLAMSVEEASETLAGVYATRGPRHRGLAATFASHYELIAHRVGDPERLSAAQRSLLGAYFTQERAIEAAALFNPSLVPHPDQSGLAIGEQRFVMSVRGVGEGHVSSVGFRSGIVGPGDTLRMDDPGLLATEGAVEAAPLDREFCGSVLAEAGLDPTIVRHVLGLLPATFTAVDIDAAASGDARDRLTGGSGREVLDRLRWMAACRYDVRFAKDVPLGERVLMPVSPAESHGVEDARFVRFAEDDASHRYYATYTAYDGSRVASHLLETEDFLTFRVSQLTGRASRDKGLALFPRRVGGRYLAISRWDRESIAVAASTDARNWGDPATLTRPMRPWELVQLGNCGSPIETPEGWIVLTHGVGPMRAYGIGALLLDLADPLRVIGSLPEPLMTAADDERDGYVPNVVYSCGAMVNGQTLVVPYGCSDQQIRVAFVDLPGLLDRLTGG
jgi:predicted GH43/DUF377 family glycosyl hydrolase